MHFYRVKRRDFIGKPGLRYKLAPGPKVEASVASEIATWAIAQVRRFEGPHWTVPVVD
jgi:hypothetical protein